MPVNVPNLLTWFRILTIPIVVGVFYCPDDWFNMSQRNLIATSVFIAAAITDWLDGYLARKLNQMSAFGAFLDPVADKLMVAAALIMLVELERVTAVIAAIIIGREIAISALREWMAGVGQGKSVAVSFIGKIKTTSQLIAIPLLLYHMPVSNRFFHFEPVIWGYWLIHVAAALTVISMFYYLKLAWPIRPKD